MYDVFRKFATDPAKEDQGVWHPLGDGKILIARDGNKAYTRMLSRLVEKHTKDLEIKGEASDQLSDTIMIECISEAIFIGFENLAYDGQIQTDSVESRKKFVAIKDFRAHVVKLSKDFDSYRLFQETEQAKN
jgi:hypothetical protein